jgi:hypothetical protein
MSSIDQVRERERESNTDLTVFSNLGMTTCSKAFTLRLVIRMTSSKMTKAVLFQTDEVKMINSGQAMKNGVWRLST